MKLIAFQKWDRMVENIERAIDSCYEFLLYITPKKLIYLDIDHII